MHTIDVRKQVYTFRVTCLARRPDLLYAFKLAHSDSDMPPKVGPSIRLAGFSVCLLFVPGSDKGSRCLVA